MRLTDAKFQVALGPLPDSEWTKTGCDRVVFEVTTNPGLPPGPLNKIASGGELARFLLALKVVLADSQPPAVMVFDEVDSGIGGATASAVGERLARLAETVQVLVVTHSPQVAARGAKHWRDHTDPRGAADARRTPRGNRPHARRHGRHRRSPRRRRHADDGHIGAWRTPRLHAPLTNSPRRKRRPSSNAWHRKCRRTISPITRTTRRRSATPSMTRSRPAMPRSNPASPR